MSDVYHEIKMHYTVNIIVNVYITMSTVVPDPATPHSLSRTTLGAKPINKHDTKWLNWRVFTQGRAVCFKIA